MSTPAKSPYLTKTHGLWLFVCFMAALLMLAGLYQSQQSSQNDVIARQQANQVVIIKNTASIAKTTRALCVARNAAADSHNALIDELVTSVRATGGTGPEQADRIARYQATMVPQLRCTTP